MPPTAVATLKAAHFVVREAPGTVCDDFIINSNPQQDASHKELLNPLLRQAFDDAIDRQQIVKTSLLGYGQPGSSIIPPALGHWHDAALKPAPFNLAKANQLLDQAGYKMGPNGVRIADGHPMSYAVIMPEATSTSYGERSYQIIQTDFKKIGVQLNAKNLDDTAAYNAILANNYKSFELSMWDWQSLIDPDFHALRADLRLVERLERHRVLQQELRQHVPGAERRDERHQAAADRLPDAADGRTARPYLVIDYADLIEAHSTHWTDLPLVGGNSWTDVQDPVRERAPDRLTLLQR